jgi:dsDNA-specific endonuclease/ATPase MutS2
MRELLIQATALRTYIDKNVEPHITDLDKLRQSAATQHGSMDEKRKLANEYAQQLQEAYIQAQQVIDKANEQASRTIGAPVDFAKKINWLGNVYQFDTGKPSSQQFTIGPHQP